MLNYLGLPVEASTHAAEIDHLIVIIHWLMTVLFVGWGAFFVFVLFRFRKGGNPRADYHGAKGKISKFLEIGIVVVEAVLLIFYAIPAWATRVRDFPAPDQAVVVRVVGEQFAWNVHYPGADGVFGRTKVELVSSTNPLGLDATDPSAKDDITTVNDLHLELNRPVIVRITSKDVIHSFSLPYMRVKQDAVPGMLVPVHFTPVHASGKEVWDIACAQLCGLGHYKMKGQYVVQTKAEFDKWMKEQTPLIASISG